MSEWRARKRPRRLPVIPLTDIRIQQLDDFIQYYTRISTCTGMPSPEAVCAGSLGCFGSLSRHTSYPVLGSGTCTLNHGIQPENIASPTHNYADTEDHTLGRTPPAAESLNREEGSTILYVRPVLISTTPTGPQRHAYSEQAKAPSTLRVFADRACPLSAVLVASLAVCSAEMKYV